MRCALVLVALAACEPALDQRLSLVDQPRVLAIVAEPPEVAPRAATPVHYTIVAGDADGPLATPPAWAYCTAGKPPTEDNAVSPTCLADTAMIALGTAPAVDATVPADACGTFGPDVPSGSASLRPRDPDPTGGYYQPIRAELGDLVAFGMTRITCNLPTAPADVAAQYRAAYVANVAPVIDAFAVEGDRVVVRFAATTAEAYLAYDPASQTLVDRRESLRASWFATAGELGEDTTGVAEARAEGTTELATSYARGTAPGPVTLWVVVRDARGGIATATTTLP